MSKSQPKLEQRAAWRRRKAVIRLSHRWSKKARVRIVASELEELVSTYCDAWAEPDAAQRRELLKRIWAKDGIYTDPTVETKGLDELVAHIGAVQRTYPGARIERIGLIDRHHRVLRFNWCMVLADGSRLPAGLDVGELTGDGKLQRIIGFFGAPKAETQS
jgi:hypothetical protein